MLRWKGQRPLALGILIILIAAFPFFSLAANRGNLGPFMNGAFPSAAPNTSPVRLVEAFPGQNFDYPMGLVELEGRDEFLVYNRQGVVHRIPSDPGSGSKELVLDLSDRVVVLQDSCFYKLVLHPHFFDEGHPGRGSLFVYYQAGDPTTTVVNNLYLSKPVTSRLSRFLVDMDTFVADPDSEVILLDQQILTTIHHGGAMFFHPVDGFLYFTAGDDGPSLEAQSIRRKLLSGVFRIDVDMDPSKSHPIRRQPLDGVTANYWIPNDNPFVDDDGEVLEEFFALGVRSPHSMTHDPVRDSIWVGDVGTARYEEISSVTPGANLEWFGKEGPYLVSPSQLEDIEGVRQAPFFSYAYGVGPKEQGGDGCVIIGPVYRGNLLDPGLQGQLIFGDFRSGRIWALNVTPGPGEREVTYLASLNPATGRDLCNFATDLSGEVYCIQLNPGRIWRLEAAEPHLNAIPSRLSHTGLFTDLQGLQPGGGLVPFEVRQPFWSDRAVKKRWMGIPNNGAPYEAGETAPASLNDAWQLPVGSVVVKHFDLPVGDGMKRLETRVIVHAENGGHYGVTYRWNEEQSDADLILEGMSEEVPLGDGSFQKWTFPGIRDCSVCHNEEAGYYLGIRTEQLNLTREGSAMNQIHELAALGVCELPGEMGDMSNWPQLTRLDDEGATLGESVRTYLAVNCAYCHRPAGRGPSFDGRFSTPLSFKKLVETPVFSVHGSQRDSLVRAGHPEESELLRRMGVVGGNQMPPLGRNLVDEQANRLVTAWVKALGEAEAEPGMSIHWFHDVDLTVAAGVDVVNEVDFVWEGGSPREGIAQDGFGARVSGIFTVPRTGRYEITASTDDGTRLYVDRRLMVDAWIPQSETPNVVSLDWNEGEEHLVEMEYFEAGGTATMRLSCLFEGEDGEDETLDDVNLFTGEHMRVSDGWLDLATRPVLEMSEAGEGGLRVRLFEEGGTFSLEMSRDLMNWIPVSEGTNGFYEVVPRSQGTFFRIKE